MVMNTGFTFRSLGATLLLSLSGIAAADTVSSSNYFYYSFPTGSFSGYSSNDVPDGDYMYVDHDILDGLSAFDPALGTLNRIEVSINADFTLEAMLDGGSPIFDPDTNLTTATATGLSALSFELIVWDESTGSRRGSPHFVDDTFMTNELTCEYMGGGCYDEAYEERIIDTSIDITDSAHTNFDNFIGTGELAPDLLTFGVVYPQTLDFVLENMENAYVDIYMDIGVQDPMVTITYDYTPSVVPLPGAFWLMLSGGGFLFGLLRRRG